MDRCTVFIRRSGSLGTLECHNNVIGQVEGQSTAYEGHRIRFHIVEFQWHVQVLRVIWIAAMGHQAQVLVRRRIAAFFQGAFLACRAPCLIAESAGDVAV